MDRSNDGPTFHPATLAQPSRQLATLATVPAIKLVNALVSAVRRCADVGAQHGGSEVRSAPDSGAKRAPRPPRCAGALLMGALPDTVQSVPSPARSTGCGRTRDQGGVWRYYSNCRDCRYAVQTAARVKGCGRTRGICSPVVGTPRWSSSSIRECQPFSMRQRSYSRSAAAFGWL